MNPQGQPTGAPRQAQSEEAPASEGRIELHGAEVAGVARAVISNPGKLNALNLAMWQQLRDLFVQLQAMPEATAPRAVVVQGEGGQFVSGADIEEFPRFRFDEDALRGYHESLVAPALRAMLDCDIPVIAQIDGPCIGGGLEIAACCDIRIGGRGSRFGIPIARLGFPMAPSELEIVAAVIGLPLLRQMLLEARLIDADEALARGVVHRIVADERVGAEALATAGRIAALSPQALRIDKRTLRQVADGGTNADQRHQHFTYADTAEHREGLTAFLEKRAPRF